VTAIDRAVGRCKSGIEVADQGAHDHEQSSLSPIQLFHRYSRRQLAERGGQDYELPQLMRLTDGIG
jgi:hypothetical protein